MNKTILLIDDDDAFQYMFRRTCRRIKEISAVYTANHGQDGLDFLEKSLLVPPLPDITQYIFVDINMPVMNGFEFLEKYKIMRLNNSAAMSNIVVVAILTSSMNQKDQDRALKLGVSKFYLGKPENIQGAYDMLTEVFRSI